MTKCFINEKDLIPLYTARVKRRLDPFTPLYTSYSRCVKSKRISNSKKKGEGNRKNGNKYLEWAYVEAANFARRFCPEAKKYYQRKLAKRNRIVATKSLAGKISKACYFILKDQEVFKKEKLFG